VVKTMRVSSDTIVKVTVSVDWFSTVIASFGYACAGDAD
jgi:hypothetical protein